MLTGLMASSAPAAVLLFGNGSGNIFFGESDGATVTSTVDISVETGVPGAQLEVTIAPDAGTIDFSAGAVGINGTGTGDGIDQIDPNETLSITLTIMGASGYTMELESIGVAFFPTTNGSAVLTYAGGSQDIDSTGSGTFAVPVAGTPNIGDDATLTLINDGPINNTPNNGTDSFKLQSLEVSFVPVPEPSVLLLGGLGFLTLLRRRR